MMPERLAVVLDEINLAANESRLVSMTINRSKDISGTNEILTVALSIRKNKLSDVAALIQECRSIDLRESLKVASQGDAK